jgi:RND superfamily putative drug exporter
VTGVLYSIGRLSGRFRWVVVAGWVVLLVAVAIGAPAMGEHLSDNLTLPGTDSQAATDLLQSEFPDQANGMIPVVFVAPKGKTVDSSDQKSAIEAATKSYEDESDMEKADDVKSVSQPSVNDSGSAAVFQVISGSAPSDEATADLVADLRETVLPEATKGNDETAYVGGSTAGYIDLAAQISSKLPLVIAVVLIVSFFLLMLAFRSILVPIKAVAMNLLSIGAAFGVVTYVFSNDWSAQLVGLDGSVPIVSFVPLMMFAILFGLSMDYEVFLMTHVRDDRALRACAGTDEADGSAGLGPAALARSDPPALLD